MAAMTALTFEILLSLADGERHGYGIIKEIEERSGRDAAPSTGALYMALQRMEADQLIVKTGPSEGEDRRRRNYRLTEKGRTSAEAESLRLVRLVAAARGKKLLSGRSV